MSDPDATLCSPGDPAQAIRLAWLRSEGLIDEARDAALIDSPGGVDQLIGQMVSDQRIDQITHDNLMAIVPTSEVHGPYITLKELGRGAMGVVFHARRINDSTEVALKVIKGAYAHDYQFRARFENECKLLEQVEHEAICNALDWDLLCERPWLAMRYVPGVPLNNYLITHGALPEGVALRIVRRIAEGLAAIEQRIGIVHRDIKPGNIIIQPDKPSVYPSHDADFPAVLIDFGLAKDVETDGGLTMAGAHMGTPAYMATEQIDNPSKVDLRADIYGLGATLFHLLTGKMPFTGSSAMDIINERMHAPQPDPKEIVASISEPCRAVVLTAMADRREDRFLSHIAMARAITKALEQQHSGVSQRFLRKPLTTTTAREQPGTGSYKRTTSSVQRRGTGQQRRPMSGTYRRTGIDTETDKLKPLGSATTRMVSAPDDLVDAEAQTPGSGEIRRSGSSEYRRHGSTEMRRSGSGSTAATRPGPMPKPVPPSARFSHGERNSGSSEFRPHQGQAGSGDNQDPFDEVPDTSSREGPGSTALRQLMKGRTTAIKRRREAEIRQAKEAVGMADDDALPERSMALPMLLLVIGLAALGAAAWKLFG